MLIIIIAFGKGKEYLKDCFDSIKEQDYKDIETVLVLDKANINPEENIEELISEFSQSINLKVYETGDNSGVSAARLNPSSGQSGKLGEVVLRIHFVKPPKEVNKADN